LQFVVSKNFTLFSKNPEKIRLFFEEKKTFFSCILKKLRDILHEILLVGM